MAAANMKTKKIVEELLECGLCMDMIERPKMLPCQHTFCLKCLYQQFNNSDLLKIRFKISCPVCRQIHELKPPNYTISLNLEEFDKCLQNHLVLNTILEMKKKHSQSQIAVENEAVDNRLINNTQRSVDTTVTVNQYDEPTIRPARSNVINSRAIRKYVSQEAGDISFDIGDEVEIINKDMSGFWIGRVRGREGLFPSHYVTEDVAVVSTSVKCQCCESTVLNWRCIDCDCGLCDECVDEHFDAHPEHQIFDLATQLQCENAGKALKDRRTQLASNDLSYIS